MNKPRPRPLGSLLFYLGMYLTTAVYAPLVVAAAPFGFRLAYGVSRRWSATQLFLLRACCGLTWEIRGRENIPPGPAIVMCKHQSAWETMALSQVFPPQVWVLKQELLRVPIWGRALAALEPIAIDRSAGRQAIKDMARVGGERLRDGLWIVVFPEGTRIPVGETGRYLPGAANLAVANDTPAVPVAVNSGLFWPRSSLQKFGGKVVLEIGPPISPTDKSAREVTDEARTWIETKTAELLAEAGYVSEPASPSEATG